MHEEHYQDITTQWVKGFFAYDNRSTIRLRKGTLSVAEREQLKSDGSESFMSLSRISRRTMSAKLAML